MIDSGKRFQGKLLGAEGGFRELIDNRAGPGGGQVVAQGLALVAEGEGGEGEEVGDVVKKQGRVGRARGEAEDGGIHLGGRPESGSGHGEQKLHHGEELGMDGEEAVVPAAGGGGEALGDFALNHQHGPFEGAAQPQEPGDHRGSDVVGEVSGDDGGPPLAQVDLKHVGRQDLQVRGRGEAWFKLRGQGAVELDGDEAAGAGEQETGKGALSRADLNDQGFDFRTGGGGDSLQRGLPDQEMLSEPGNGQPRTSMWLRRKVMRALPEAGWPNMVAGVNLVHSKVFSTLRRTSGAPDHCCPAGME